MKGALFAAIALARFYESGFVPSLMGGLTRLRVMGPINAVRELFRR